MSKDGGVRELNQARKVISEINKFNHAGIQRRERKIDDILQTLFGDDVFETTKLLMVIELQEQATFLIDTADEAEQVFGSLLNIYKFINNSSIIKPQILITCTIIALDFNFKVSKQSCLDQLIGLMIDIVLKGSAIASNSLLVSSCLSCLEMLEETYKGFLLEYLERFMLAADVTRTFAAANFMQLIGCVLKNSNTSKKSVSSRINLDKESMLRYEQFLLRQMNSLSSTSLLKIFPKVVVDCDKKKISKSILQTFFMYCCQSSDIMLIYLAFLIMNKLFPTVQMTEDANTTRSLLIKLLFSHQMNQLPPHETDLLRVIATDTFKECSSSQQKECFLPYLYSFLPQAHERLNSMLQKIRCILNVYSMCNQEIPEQMLFSMNKCLFQAMHEFNYHHIKDIFKCLLLIFKNATSNVRSVICRLLQTNIEESLLLTSDTTSFCCSIKTIDLNISKKLLASITTHVLQLQDFNEQSWFYLFKIFLQLSSEKDICPSTIIDKISDWCEKRCFDELSYTNGCMLLSVLSSILINHEDMQYAYKISGILWDISENCKDLNLRERTLFYYCVIGSISQEQYKDLLETINYSMKDIPSAIGGKLEFDHYSFMSPIAGVTSSIKRTKKVFSLKKLPYVAVNTNCLSIRSEQDILNGYFNFIDSSNCSKEITVKLNISFLRNSEYVPSEVYAINLKFKSDSSTLQSIDDYTCPYLSSNTSGDGIHTNHDFLLQLKPISPVTCNISVSATFFDDDQCSTCALEHIELNFKDFFKPFPMGMSEECRLELFHRLWDYIDDTQRSAENTKAGSILSVKNLSTTCDFQTIVSSFEHYIIGQVDNVIRIGIFLPPSNHFLMQVTDLNGNMVVSVATDNFKIIDLIDSFLNELKIER